MGRHVGRRAVLRAAALLSLLVAASFATPAALAQHGHGGGHGEGHGEGHGPGHGPGRGNARGGPAQQWHGNIERFHDHDWGVWRGGHWAHARHGGPQRRQSTRTRYSAGL